MDLSVEGYQADPIARQSLGRRPVGHLPIHKFVIHRLAKVIGSIHAVIVVANSRFLGAGSASCAEPTGQLAGIPGR